MNKPSDPAIICRNIHKFFGGPSNRVEALRGVNLEINHGEFRMLMGPSGSGKTTLISVISGILTQDEGDCLVENIDLNRLPDQERTRFRGLYFGFVYQVFNLIPMLTNEENVAIPLLIRGVSRLEALERAKHLLNEIGMGDKIGAFPPDLSGGQKQRIAIARAMVTEPRFIVCDEPTSFLDHVAGKKIMELLKDLVVKKGITLIIVTHDPRIVEFADCIDYLEDGRIERHEVRQV